MSKTNSGYFKGTVGSISYKIMLNSSGTDSSILNNPVLQAKRTGSAKKTDKNHAFPDIIDNYINHARKFSLVGGDGVQRTLFQLKGSLNGQSGIFEWILDPNPNKGVTHRRFIPHGKITGRPNQKPKE